MKRLLTLATLSGASLSVSGCTSVITAPFRAAGTILETAVDATTQTQQEADEDRGKRLRKAEKNEVELRQKCDNDPDSRACDDLRDLDRERTLTPRR